MTTNTAIYLCAALKSVRTPTVQGDVYWRMDIQKHVSAIDEAYMKVKTLVLQQHWSAEVVALYKVISSDIQLWKSTSRLLRQKYNKS
jgi:hypothetical protein